MDHDFPSLQHIFKKLLFVSFSQMPISSHTETKLHIWPNGGKKTQARYDFVNQYFSPFHLLNCNTKQPCYFTAATTVFCHVELLTAKPVF